MKTAAVEQARTLEREPAELRAALAASIRIPLGNRPQEVSFRRQVRDAARAALAKAGS